MVVIDIEVWKLTSSMTSSQITTNINKLKTVISAFRKGLPNAKIGLYMGVPERNWLAVCGDPGKRASRTTTWHNNNLRLRPLGDAVDIIFPSLYTFYSDSASISCWPSYAQANIREARIYGKPVVPFLWMRYHSTNAWIPRTFFAQAARNRLHLRGRRGDLEPSRRLERLELVRAVVAGDEGLLGRQVSGSLRPSEASRFGGTLGASLSVSPMIQS